MTVRSIFNSLSSLLKLALNTEYYKQSLSCETDQELRELLSQMIVLERADLDSVMERVSGNEGRVLGVFAERMASLSVRLDNIEYVKDGLFALLLYSRLEDRRDVLAILSLLHDAAIKINGNASDVFNEMRSMFGRTDFLCDFLKRSSEDKSIDAMGYEESKTTEGFLYIRTW